MFKKSTLFILFIFLTALVSNAQVNDTIQYSFSTAPLPYDFKFIPVLDEEKSTNSYSFLQSEKQNFSNFDIELEALNKKLFSNIVFVENTYIDYTQYLRGCGPLEDGVSNPVDSGDLMLSLFVDNFINNVLFPKGVFSSFLNN